MDQQEMQSEVTVGLVVKNCERTINRALTSIASQDFPSHLMRIIIVDDDSNDRTLPIVKDTVSKLNVRTRILESGGKGLGAARNLVLQNALGKYIIWIDGDMVIPKDFVTRQVEFMEHNPEVGKARSKREKVQNEKIVATLENLSVLCYEAGNTEITSRLLGIGASICRAQALRQVGGFDETFKGATEDIDIEARIRAAGWKVAQCEPRFYHKERDTWNALWTRYLWYGYGMHFFIHKHPKMIILWQTTPLVALAVGVVHSIRGYKTTRRKISFLLPLQYFLKRLAFWVGFFKSHITGYEYKPRGVS